MLKRAGRKKEMMMTSTNSESLRSAAGRVQDSLLIVMLVVLLTAMAWGMALLLAREELELETARVHQVNGTLARAFEEHVRYVVQTADNALLFLKSEYEEEGEVSGHMVDFVERARHDRILNQIAVANAQGDLILSAVPLQKTINISSHETFQRHLQSAALDLYIAKPIITQVSGTWSFFLSRRLNRPDGSFGGQAAVGLNPKYFAAFFSDPSFSAGKSIMLLGLDGIVRARCFQGNFEVGQDLSKSPLAEAMKQKRIGHHELVSSIDGLPRFGSYRVLQDYPLVVVVADLQETALASFEARKTKYYFVALLVTLLVAGFGGLLLRAEGRSRRQNLLLLDELEERKKAEDSARESEQRYRLLSEVAFDGVVLSENGIFLEVNEEFAHIFGFEPAEIIGEQVASVIAPECRDEVVAKITGGYDKIYETVGIRKDGSRFPFEASGKSFPYNNRILRIAAVRDISERRRVENEIRKSQKLESLGVLSGGIAHDFNNLLTVILGNTELALLALPEDSPLRVNLDPVFEATMRARDLVSQILAFSRMSEQELRPLQLQVVIKETMKLLRSTIPSTVEIKQDIDPACGTIIGDLTKINQVLINLCTNAVDAMDEKGLLTIRLTQTHLEQNFLARYPGLEAGAYALLAVSDTGVGFGPEIMERVFDPFFTTKAVGKGTGMGLSMVHGIVMSHHGLVRAASAPGKGATFEVYFPIVEGNALAAAETEQRAPGGTERLLLVDDEKSITEMWEEVFKCLGYQVTATTNSAVALELFRATPDAFDLVLTDQTMPGLSGAELALELLRLRPDIPIILCTGFSTKMSAEDAARLGIREFFMKPLSSAELAHGVRKVLDQTGVKTS